jgi:hypothetical protein
LDNVAATDFKAEGLAAIITAVKLGTVRSEGPLVVHRQLVPLLGKGLAVSFAKNVLAISRGVEMRGVESRGVESSV